jgi:hypothetical protein
MGRATGKKTLAEQNLDGLMNYAEETSGTFDKVFEKFKFLEGEIELLSKRIDYLEMYDQRLK